MTKIPVPAAVLAAAVLAGCSTAPLGTHPVITTVTAPPASFTLAPVPVSVPAPQLPVAGTGQTVTFAWPASAAGSRPTTWKMTVVGVRHLSSGPPSGQPSGHRDFCLALKLTLTGPAWVLYGGQLSTLWTWRGADGQVTGGSNTGVPAFDSATCQSLFPGTEDLADTVNAPSPGRYVTGSEAFSVPPGAGVLWLDGQDGQLLAGISAPAQKTGGTP